MWQSSHTLPVISPEHIATLGEGNTPLVRSNRVGPSLGLSNLYFKVETQNPTGSYKDRFASLAASLMLQEGRRKMVATSSGNTGSALAAYAARFGLQLDLYVLENAPEEKLIQALAFGASVFRVRGFGISRETTDRVFDRLRLKSEKEKAVLLVSAFCLCPREMEGVKTIAYEITRQLGEGPHHLFVPVGGGGLFLSCYQGLQDDLKRGRIAWMPKCHPVQPQGCATVVGPLSQGKARAEAVHCRSHISGLQVASLLDAQDALEKTLLSGGQGQMVSDEAIYLWQRRLIREEGIFTEPAGAAALAGLAAAVERDQIQAEETVVCLVTGSGFKDGASIRAVVADSTIPVLNVEEICS
jgi:threonine synthase